jgi:anti-anti-sigma factor
MLMPLMDVDRLGTTTLVRFNQEVLDWDAAKVAGDELVRLVRQTRPRRLRLDLGNVKLLTAAMLGRFLDVQRAVVETGGEMTLCNVGFPLYQLFEVTGLAGRLDIQTEFLHVGTEETIVIEDGLSAAWPESRTSFLSS